MTAQDFRSSIRRGIIIAGVGLVIVLYAILAPFAALFDYFRYEWTDDIADVWDTYVQGR